MIGQDLARSATATTSFAQQGGPTFGHQDAYESGGRVGRIAADAMIAAVVIWAVFKLIKIVRDWITLRSNR